MAKSTVAPKSRRAASHRPPTALALLAALPMLACIALAAWLHWAVAPEAAQSSAGLRAEITRARAMTDSVVVESLAHTLAGGDYGEVQETLARYENVNYLSRALVTNAADKIVAAVGDAEGARMGEAVPQPLLRSGRRIAITTGGRGMGYLLILAPHTPAPDETSRTAANLRAVALFVALFALLSASAIAWLWWEARNAARLMRTKIARPIEEIPTQVLQDRLDRPTHDAGPQTLQHIESELRKRVALSREKRAAPNSAPANEPASTGERVER